MGCEDGGLPLSHCCAIMTQPAGKVLPSAPGGGLPEVLRPTERPVRQRSGLAATDEWRAGRRRATGLPEEERATQRARKSSAWVRATVASKKARRTGAAELHRYAAWYVWLLGKAHGVTYLLLVFCWSVPDDVRPLGGELRDRSPF